MKKQTNFYTYLDEKYGKDYSVHNYEQYVQLSTEKGKGETLSFHFNKDGFFDGAYHKADLYDKGRGDLLIAENDEKNVALFSPVMSEKIQGVFDNIYQDMMLDKWIEKANERLNTFRNQKKEDIPLENSPIANDIELVIDTEEKKQTEQSQIYAYTALFQRNQIFQLEDQTFIALDAKDLEKAENTMEYNGQKLIPLNDTPYKNRDIYDVEGKDFVLLVDSERLKDVFSKIGDSKLIIQAVQQAFPNLSIDNAQNFVLSVLSDKTKEGKKEPAKEEPVLDEYDLDR